MKINNRCLQLQLSALAIAGLFYSLQASALNYTITGLGAGRPFDLNDNGQLVGSGNNGNAFIWDGNTVIDTGIRGNGFGINNAGQITGSTHDFFTNYQGNGFFRDSNGAVTQIINIFGGGYSNGYAINNNGQVVGWAVGLFGDQHVYLWTQQGGMTDLGLNSTSPYRAGFGINDTQQVLSASGYVWTSNTGWIDTGISGGQNAYGINNNGQVVGWKAINGEYHAVTWSSNLGLIDLGTKSGFDANSSWDLDINDLGQIVADDRWLWDPSTGWQDLTNQIVNSTGWTLMGLSGINNNGQIAGYGWYGGVQTVFILNPAPVPIPATFWLFGSGLLGLFGFMRRRKA